MAIAAAVSVWSAGSASAQMPPRFDSWTTDNGLPQNSVNDILQTRDGYLWLATHGGLVRFDGVRFVTFDRSTDGIRSQRIKTLHEDRHGVLWAGTEDGMLLQYRDGRFRTYGADDGLPHAGAVRIEESADGQLWITWVGVVTRYDGRTFTNLTPADFDDRVKVPPIDRYLDAWWARVPEGLRALVQGQPRTVDIRQALGGANVRAVQIDRCAQLWISTTDGAFVQAAADGRVERHPVDEGDVVARSEGWFLGDCRQHVWHLDPRGRVSRYREGRREPLGLDGVRSAFVDAEGSAWFGTIAAGLHRLRDDAIVMHRLGEHAEDNFAYAVAQDRSGTIWIGSGGLKSVRSARTRTHLDTHRLSDGTVTAIYEDRSGRVWVAMTNGLNYVHNGRVVPHENGAGVLDSPVRAMLEDRTGRFWFGTDRGLVTVWDGAFRRFSAADGLSHDRVTALFEDHSGALWIGG
jgi:ligand-binding sensor domain-containing protein